jgi:hypothetical protein
MRNDTASKNSTTRRILLVACSAALAVAFTVSPSRRAHAARITPPPVPDTIRIEEGNKPFLQGLGIGTQNYICLPCPNPTTPATACPDASGFAWLLFTPEAVLFTDNDKQLTTHFFSPNPDENGTIRATWRHSRDTSIVWGGAATVSNDADFVEPGAVAWLRLPMAGTQEGPRGGDIMTATTFIHRVNTHGGLAPSTGCARLADVGAKAFVPYSADYIFYTKSK